MDYSSRQMRTWKISGVGIPKMGGADPSHVLSYEQNSRLLVFSLVARYIIFVSQLQRNLPISHYGAA
jgi:hypothetical protein